MARVSQDGETDGRRPWESPFWAAELLTRTTLFPFSSQDDDIRGAYRHASPPADLSTRQPFCKQ